MIVIENIALFKGHADQYCPVGSVVIEDNLIRFAGHREARPEQIGRASCRERV